MAEEGDAACSGNDNVAVIHRYPLLRIDFLSIAPCCSVYEYAHTHSKLEPPQAGIAPVAQ
jgi:hypothetical protein